MTKLQIMFFLQTFILRCSKDFDAKDLDYFEYDVKNIVKSCADYETISNKLIDFAFSKCRNYWVLFGDFVSYLFEIEKILKQVKEILL